MLGEGMGFGWAATCYSGVTTPLVPEALWRCERMGFARDHRLSVLPVHRHPRKTDPPKTPWTLSASIRETEFLSAGYLDVHPLLFEVFLERAEEAIHGSPNMNCELCKYRVRLPGFEQAVGQPQVGTIITSAASVRTVSDRTTAALAMHTAVSYHNHR